MQYPYKIIESKTTTRDQFEMVEGHQPTHALFYLKKGNFTIEFGGKKEKIDAGNCMILPDYIHFRRHVLDPIEFVYVKFSYNLNCPYSFEIPYGKVNFKDKKRFCSSIDALERLIMCEDLLSAGYREHLLMDILFQIHFDQNENHNFSDNPISHDQLVGAAIAYIAENLNQKIMIEDLCHAVGTNASTLNFRFRREFSMSIGQFIMNERMKRAEHLLIGTTYKISEIAYRCGFENVYYFSNAFKKAHGVSPSDYLNDFQKIKR